MIANNYTERRETGRMQHLLTYNFSRITWVLFLNLFIYLFIFVCVGPLLLSTGFSLVVASRGYSLAVRRLLIAVASFVEYGL